MQAAFRTYEPKSEGDIVDAIGLSRPKKNSKKNQKIAIGKFLKSD
jgi:hypothetical protein